VSAEVTRHVTTYDPSASLPRVSVLTVLLSQASSAGRSDAVTLLVVEADAAGRDRDRLAELEADRVRRPREDCAGGGFVCASVACLNAGDARTITNAAAKRGATRARRAAPQGDRTAGAYSQSLARRHRSRATKQAEADELGRVTTELELLARDERRRSPT
jgi:hypothetical protein